jgi:hypothetical protein
MAEQKPKMTRQQAEQALARGEHLAVAGRHVTHKRDLPPRTVAPDGTPGPDELEAVVARTPDGKLTHAGMRHAIEHGGSVLHQGEVLTSLEQLPTEADLARGNDQQTQAVAQSIDQQIAALQQQRARLALPAAGQQPAPPAPTQTPAQEPPKPTPEPPKAPPQPAPAATRGPTAETKAGAADDDFDQPRKKK